MPTTALSSPPSPGSSSCTTSSHALSTPSSSTSPSIPLADAHTTTTSGSGSGSGSASVFNGPATLHKRAPPSSNPPPPARLQQMHNMYPPQSSGSSSSSRSTAPTSNKLVKKEHPTLGSLHDFQSSTHKPQGNRLRKVMHNGDSHKVEPSCHDPDELVLPTDDGLLTDANSPPPSLPSTTHHTAASTKPPQRPEPVRQQSFSKRHASFDTPRTEVPLPFFSELFPRELERHQQKRSELDETTEPLSHTRHSSGPTLPIPTPTTAPLVSQPRPPSPIVPLIRNNSAPTPPSSPLSAPTYVQDLKETESLRDREERAERAEKEEEPIVPSSIAPPSSEGSIGRRSTASLPLPGDHAGEPLYRLDTPPPASTPFPMSYEMHPLLSIPAAGSFAPPRAFSLPPPPPPPPAAPEISTPPTTLHPLLDIPASASSSASSIPPTTHASASAVSPQSSAPPPPASASAPTTTSISHPTTSTSNTILSSLPPSQPSTPTTIATGPQGPHMTVQTTSTAYILTTFLPGFQRDEITLSTRKRRVLHVVADPFLSSLRGTGHFERRISFGYDADMAHIRAEFNGGVLKIVVPRRPTVSLPAGYDSKFGLGGQQGNVWSTHGP